MAGAILLPVGPYLVPGGGGADMAVAPDFERFDGLTQLDNPAGNGRPMYGAVADNPRPGQSVTTPDVYTPGPISGVVGTLGGQPLPAKAGVWKEYGDYQHSRGVPSMQFRLGVGQNFGGAQQTVALSEITSNPPVPGDITGIIAGLG